MKLFLLCCLVLSSFVSCKEHKKQTHSTFNQSQANSSQAVNSNIQQQQSTVNSQTSISHSERTFAMIKPPVASSQDNVIKIQAMIQNAGLRVVKAKKVKLTADLLNKLYYMHREKPFFKDIKKFTNQEVVVQIVEGQNAIQKYRELMGNVDPQKANDGTIRAIFGTNKTFNAVHGSDSEENAKREICIFFAKDCHK